MKTQPRVIGEEWSDERVKAFLNLTPHDDLNADYYLLIQAYQSMRSNDFGRFIQFFLDMGHDINATDKDGCTIFNIVSQHRCSNKYIDLLKNAGAKDI